MDIIGDYPMRIDVPRSTIVMSRRELAECVKLLNFVFIMITSMFMIKLLEKILVKITIL